MIQLVFPQFSMPYRASMVSGPGGMVLLALLVGAAVHAALAVIFIYASAFAAAGVLMATDRAFRRGADFRFKGLFATLVTAFTAFVVVTWGVDFIAKSYLSPPMMIIVLGRQACWPECFLTRPGEDLMVTSIPSYYAYAAGLGPLAPLRYVLLAVPGTIAIALALMMTHPSSFSHGTEVPHPIYPDRVRSTRDYAQVFAGRGTLTALVIATLVCVFVALFVTTPAYMTFLLAMAELVKQ